MLVLAAAFHHNRSCRIHVAKAIIFTVRGQRGESYGEEKEGQEENQVVLKLQARASYWRETLGFRGVIDLAKRLNGVRPLLL